MTPWSVHTQPLPASSSAAPSNCSKIKMTCLTAVFSVALLACGGVTPVDVHDPRLSLEARLWVGGAEDAVAIAGANLDDARAELAELESWRRTLPKSLGGGTLDAAFGAWVSSRSKVAEVTVNRARLELDLAQIALEVTHAETAMRHDLAVYDLVTLRARKDGARAEVDAATRLLEEAALAREAATTAFWSAYRQAGQSPDSTRLFWSSPPR